MNSTGFGISCKTLDCSNFGNYKLHVCKKILEQQELRFLGKNHCAVYHSRWKRSGTKRYGYLKTVPKIDLDRWCCHLGKGCENRAKQSI